MRKPNYELWTKKKAWKTFSIKPWKKILKSRGVLHLYSSGRLDFYAVGLYL